MLVSHTVAIGGSEQCLLLLATALTASGREVLVVLPHGEGPFPGELRRAGVRITQASMPWWMMHGPPRLRDAPRIVSGWLSGGLGVHRALEGTNVDVVGTISSVVPGGAIAAWLRGVPHVWHVRECFPTVALHPLLGRRATRWLIEALSTKIVVPSRVAGRIFDGSPKLHVVPEAVAARFFDTPPASRAAVRASLGIPADERVILVIGVLVPAKGQLSAVRALASLAARGVRARLVLCGTEWDPAYRERVLAEAARLGVADRLVLLGFRSDVIALLDASDVLLVSSQTESFGLTVVEAMARRVPVVATRCGGPEETLVDGETGLLVDVGDSEAMAEGLFRLLGSPELEQRLRDAAFVEAGRYHPDRALGMTLRDYDCRPGSPRDDEKLNGA